MIIKSIELNNYRLYKGVNRIDFVSNDEKNLFLISGENGFGKTTFLHSLIWCLYGKLITEVETEVRKDISVNGYSSFLHNNLNKDVLSKCLNIDKSIIDSIKKDGYGNERENLKSITQYSVAIDFGEIVIPSLPCTSIRIIRSYDWVFERETVEILIDGVKNELTNEIGPDVFINDFILNKDIARFFFFDSEQIVALAETNTITEKRHLCSAYNEVLGVRKYEDLKKNIENVRIRFRRKSSDRDLREKFESLLKKQENLNKKIIVNKERTQKIENEIKELRTQDGELQIQLMREGNSTTNDEIKRTEALIATTKQKDEEYKKQLKLFLDYAPFAIVGNLFCDTKNQLVTDKSLLEAHDNQLSRNAIVMDITSDIQKLLQKIELEKKVSEQLNDGLQGIISKYNRDVNEGSALLVMADSDYEEFMSVYSNVVSTYKLEFERLTDDYRKNKIVLDRNSRKLSNINQKEKDELIKKIRSNKNEIEAMIIEAEKELRLSHETYGTLNQELATTNKQITELSKRVSLDDIDAKKDKLAEQLINELSVFLSSLKQEKKYSLERRIKTTLNNLMHKEDFIGKVEVVIDDDNMDIDLFSADNVRINKDSLSKGEQQLYATSILKALVDESGIQFPVFIDSPLQKFDKSHATKIITEFYPLISKQVVLFPLLHKELTQDEYEVMKPLVNATYLIKNDTTHSYFENVEINKFMTD